ncbi:helicase [Microbacterium aurum]
MSREVQERGYAASAEEQQILARWSSWGAVPQVFDERNEDWAAERAQLRSLFDDDAYAAARRTTINAHYTDVGYARAMWSTLQALGFEGGRVLEPGSGAGTFIGLAPDEAQMVGVELDPTTAAIARALYPRAEVRTESFADSRFARGQFDAMIGNVPFDRVVLHDPLGNPNGHSMHDHFIVKSLNAVRPGGVAAVLTSSFTMDKVNPAARREMNALADLVGAVRLPTGAHRRAAGTEAVTDLLIFRRREDGTAPRDLVWETVTPRVVDGERIRINSYFDAHPQRVLGEIHVGNGMYGNATMQVVPDDLAATAQKLEAALDDIVALARERGQLMTPATAVERADRDAAADALTDLWDGTIVAGAERDTFQIARGGVLEELSVPRSQAAELRELIALRDGARGLLQAEQASDDDTRPDALRADLKARYEAYVGRYGALNRFTLRPTGRYEKVLDDNGRAVIDPDTGKPLEGDEITARVSPPVWGRFRQDPQSALVRALERFDDETQGSRPATLLLERQVAPRAPREGADTPVEAIALSLDQTGKVELPTVARLLGVDEAEAREQLGTLVYDDPVTGEIVHAPEYLSGDVRTKLDAAQAAAASDSRFQANVHALAAVLPEPIPIDQIEARMGAVWISPLIHQQFLAEILQDRSVRVENPLPGTWDVQGMKHTLRATNEWGTSRRSAIEIAAALMEQRPIEVKDRVEGPGGSVRYVLNPVETTAAQEKADALSNRFREWVWEEPARAAALSERYQRQFNSIVLRDYTSAGEHLTLPGLSQSIALREHQRTAVARMISEPAVGLFHGVGAGKTLEMVVGATELKRLGLIDKPAVVVPNHMLEQFSREWLQAYPHARILAASTKDLTGDSRRLFVARAAANDWDAIVMTQGAFKAIGLSADFEQRYIGREVESLKENLEIAKEDGSTRSVKQIEKAVQRAEERLKKSLDIPRDPGISFQDTGIDYLVVDEAHMYKNLATVSNITDAQITGSEKARDLHMKLEYLRERHGERVATLATATPLANSITEAHVMQRYLRPDLLEKAGVDHFDAWAATFGTQVSEMEMGPAGGFRQKTRFARFQNVPEMLRMWHVFADVKASTDLGLPLPALAPRPSDGVRDVETVVLQPSPEVAEYIERIAERAELVAAKRVDPRDDNMLLISGDGRKAALDLRLVDEGARPTGPVKLDAVAANILRTWQETKDNTYTDDTGEVSPVRGALQLVFSDLGTPSETRWDVYHELRSKLVDGGMPVDAIRFMHEAKNDAAKGRLFAAARAGHVSVLIGSTEKMGVGTNVQARLAAMHHVDCPWRPADLEQRDGRGIRQGNQNPEVAVYRYVVERSFDAYSWQTVARKAGFIAQVMRGDPSVRSIDDIGDTALSAAEAKALASGNPLVLERANAEADLQKLRRQQTGFERSQSAARHARAEAVAAISSGEQQLDALRLALERTTDVSGENFVMEVNGQRYDSRADAGAAIGAWAFRNTYQLDRATGAELRLGELAGHEIVVTPTRRVNHSTFQAETVARVELRDVPASGSDVALPDLRTGGVGLVRILENKTTAIAASIPRVTARVAEAQRTVQEADVALSRSFPHAEALVAAAAHFEDVTARLAEHAAAQQQRDAEPSRVLAELPERGRLEDRIAREVDRLRDGEQPDDRSPSHVRGHQR